MTTDLGTRVATLQRAEAELAGSVSTLQQSVEVNEAEVLQLASYIDIAEKAKAVLESYAVEQQTELQQAVESLCTRGLQAVFQKPLEFKMHFKVLRGQPECSFSVISRVGDEPVEMDIPNSFGGGLAVVCAVLLRVVVLKYLVEQGKVAPLLVLDEPLAALSPDYSAGEAESLRSHMAEFLGSVSRELGVQILMVTHEPDYEDAADMYYEFAGGLGEDTTVAVSRGPGSE